MSYAKTPEAAERERVYQLGQRAYNGGTANPFASTDWRSKTWMKGYAAAEEYRARAEAKDEAERRKAQEQLDIDRDQVLHWLEDRFASMKTSRSRNFLDAMGLESYDECEPLAVIVRQAIRNGETS